MALEMMFQDTSTEVNVSSQGGKKASRMIDNIASKPTDNGMLKTLESAGSAARQYNATQSTLEATQARQDYLKLMMSPEYRDGSSSNRAEVLESIYKNNSANKSQAYTDAFTTYSSGQYMQEYDKREIEVDNSYYEQAGASYTAYMDADSDIQHPAWKEGYDEDMRYMTNKEAGRTPADFVEAYQTLRPRLDKVVIGTGIVKDLYGEMAFNISMAQTPGELKEALSNNEEMKQPFKSPFFLENKSKQGLTELSKLDTQISNIITVKKKELVLRDKNTIETNPHMEDEEVGPLIANTTYDETTGMIDEGKYNAALEKYQTRRTNIQEMNVYDAELDLEKSTSAEKLRNPEIKKKHTKNVTEGLFNNVGGSVDSFSNIVHSNADFLKEYRSETMGTLFSTEANNEDKEALWANTKELMDSEKGYTALKSIYGKDIESIQGVLLLQRLKGFDRDTAIERVNKYKDNPDQDRIIKDVSIAMADSAVDYGPLQDEVKTLLTIAVAGGADQEAAYDAIEELMEENITEIGGVPAFKLTGEIPAVSEKAKDMFDAALTSQIDVFKEMNGGNPIQVEVLNNGKAIVRDATWGYKLKGYIDLQGTADKAETAAVNTPPLKIEKEAGRLTNETVQGVSGLLKSAADAVKEDFDYMAPGMTYNALKYVGQGVYDFFNPELSKEKLHRLKENQSSTSKKIIEEKSVSLNLGNYFSNPFDLQASEDFTDISQAGVERLPMGTYDPGVELSEYGRIDPETGLEVEYEDSFSPIDETMDRLKTLEGDYLHKDGLDLLTMPYGIVPDLGTLYRNDTGEELTSKEVPSDMAKLSNAQLKGKIETYMAEKSGLERSNYASDKEFAAAVVDKFSDNTASAVNKSSNYPKEHKWDTMTATQKTVLLDLAWNGSTSMALYNDTKDAVIEGGKLMANRRTSEMVKIMNNFRSGKAQPRGLLKRRAMAYNLMARPEDIAVNIVTSPVNNSSGKRVGTKYKVMNSGGKVIFETNRKVTKVGIGTLEIPQLPIPE